MKDLFTCFSNFWSNILGSESRQLGLISEEAAIEQPLSTHSAPFGTRWKPAGNQHSLSMCAVMFVLLFVAGVGNAWGACAIPVTNSAITLPRGSTTVTTGDWIAAAGVTKAGNSWAYSDWTGDQTIGTYGSITFSKAGDLNNANLLQLQNGGGTISTTITSPAGVDIVIGCKRSGTKGTVTVSLTGADDDTSFSSTSWSTIEISTTSTTAVFSVTKRGDNGLYISYITITPKAASCTTNATVTAGSNSSVTKNSARVTCSSGISSLGSAGCSISSYGFVLGTSSNPTTSNTTYEVGTSYTSTGVSFYKDITGLSAGTTYYVRPYATNGNGTSYGTQTTFTTLFEASITLNKNTSDAGSTAGSAKAVENATSLSSITAPTRTGYNLEGYYTTSECATKIATSAGVFQPSITVSSNTWTNGSSQWKRNASETFYAKWTAKTTTVSFNQTSGTGGQTGTLTATYGSAMPSAPVTVPTRDGYDFGGYYDGSGGTGTQYYTNTGASARNWDKEDATYTLHAKWTLKSYTVTWKVNNENYSAGGSSSVTHGNHIATLPSAPNRPTYGCGDVFVGWTNVQNYVHGTSPLYTTAAEFPNATGDQVFYAVYADYTTD